MMFYEAEIRYERCREAYMWKVRLNFSSTVVTIAEGSAASHRKAVRAARRAANEDRKAREYGVRYVEV